MAKFFNQKVKKKKKKNTSFAIVAVIIVILLIISVVVLVSVFSGNKHTDAIVTLRSDAAVEINSEEVDKTLFFEKIENVKEKDIKVDYSKVDFNKVGTYDVNITIYKKKYSTKLQVVDTESPVLKTKDVSISAGNSYKASDFVDSCKDNSNKECKVEFYDSAVNQKGDKIDYSAYTSEGAYTVQIVASDESGNKTTPVNATLTIGKGEKVQTTCTYGNNEYDSKNNIMAIDVTDNGCAIDLNLYQDEKVLAPVNELITSETAKIKKEFAKIKLDATSIYIKSSIDTIINNDGKGVVGYSVRITLSILNNNNDEIIEDYYVNTNGSRNYIVNKYL